MGLDQRNSRRRKYIMANELNGMKVAILVADGFEQVEVREPRKALEQAGAQVHLYHP